MNDAFESRLDPDHTLLRPNPGGRRPGTAAEPSVPSQNLEHPSAIAAVSGGEGLNPLVRAANPLLDLVLPLRSLTQAPDIEALHERLVTAVRHFESQARNGRLETATIAAARYALCTLIDETISSTPWGAGVWSARSLLVTFHNEAWGGEKFFLILQRLSQDPEANVEVLELMYLCLALGLEGRYRVLERGGEQLNILRERLARLIRQQRGAVEQELSPHWRGVAPQRSLLRGVPLWVMAAIVAVLLLILQLTYVWLLNRASDPVFAQQGGIRLVSPLKAPVSVGPPPVRVSSFLAPEIAEGLVSVRESADRSIIVLRGDGVFASGSAEVARSFEPLLARIGDALNTLPGQVVVVGHTDDVRPSPTSRLSSNFDLSNARAKSVARLLAERAGPVGRYRSEGRGETEPLVSNDSAANRARNRRVDITVLIPSQP